MTYEITATEVVKRIEEKNKTWPRLIACPDDDGTFQAERNERDEGLFNAGYKLGCTESDGTADSGVVRTFKTGATRDTAEGKIDYEGFISPVVLKRFGEYMDTHRKQSDGTFRASDNWQKGIPLDVYAKSMWRHFLDFLLLHRGWSTPWWKQEEVLCAILFNVQGYLHVILTRQMREKIDG